MKIRTVGFDEKNLPKSLNLRRWSPDGEPTLRNWPIGRLIGHQLPDSVRGRCPGVRWWIKVSVKAGLRIRRRWRGVIGGPFRKIERTSWGSGGFVGLFQWNSHVGTGDERMIKKHPRRPSLSRITQETLFKKIFSLLRQLRWISGNAFPPQILNNNAFSSVPAGTATAHPRAQISAAALCSELKYYKYYI